MFDLRGGNVEHCVVVQCPHPVGSDITVWLKGVVKSGSFFFGVDCLIVTQYPPPTDLWDPGSRWASAPHSCPGSVTHSGEFLYVTVCLCGTATNKIRLDSAQGLIVQCCCNSKIKCVSVYV